MPAPQNVERIVSQTLKTLSKAGPVTVNDVTTRSMGRLDREGGYPPSVIQHAVRGLVSTEVKRQLKRRLPETLRGQVLVNAPPELAMLITDLEAFIAIETGRNAHWVSSLTAEPEDWVANAALKEQTAQKTIAKADKSMQIALYLQRHGIRSLSDGMT